MRVGGDGASITEHSGAPLSPQPAVNLLSSSRELHVGWLIGTSIPKNRTSRRPDDVVAVVVVVRGVYAIDVVVAVAAFLESQERDD